jgi:hypothetical protein
VDADDNVVLVGSTQSPDFPVHDGFQMIKVDDGGSSGFIFKLDSGGSRVWATYFHSVTNTGGGACLMWRSMLTGTFMLLEAATH